MLLLILFLLVLLAIIISVLISYHALDHSTLSYAILVTSTRGYRVLLNIYAYYQRCESMAPKNSYQFFRDEVEYYLDREMCRKPDKLLGHISKMLENEDYIRYYFKRERFGVVEYDQMWAEYRSGKYKTKPFSLTTLLKQTLPPKILNARNGLDFYLRLCDDEWLSRSTGMPVEGLPENVKAYLAQSLFSMLGLRGYPKVMGDFWGVKNIVANRQSFNSSKTEDYHRGKLKALFPEDHPKSYTLE